MPMLAVECGYTEQQVNAMTWLAMFTVGDLAEKSFQLKVAGAGRSAAMGILGGVI